MESHCIWLSESRWIANFSILMTSCLFDVSNCILSTPRWVCLKNQDSFSFLSIPAFSLDSWLLKLLSEFNLSTGYVHHCTSICILCVYIYMYIRCLLWGWSYVPPKMQESIAAIIRGMDVIHFPGHPANPLGDSSPATMCIHFPSGVGP